MLAACVHVKIEENRQVVAAIGAGEAIVLVARPQQEGVGSESDFIDCLERQLVGQESAPSRVRVVSHQSFVDSLYPWLEPSTAIVDGDFAATLLTHAGLRERIAKTGVRYLVAIDGNTNVVNKSGSMSCFIGPGAGGCLGVAFWKKQSGYEANIWDLERGLSLGTVGTDVSGNSVFIGALVPLPFLAPVQHTACTRLATELKRFLAGPGG